MDGHYQQIKKNHIVILNKWINRVIKNQGWKTFDDLHIDEIDEKFKLRENWISKGILLFKFLFKLIDTNVYDAFLIIPLSGKVSANNFSIISLNSLNKQLDDVTPPSMYLFPIGEGNYEQTIASCKFLENISNEIGLRVYYREEKDGDEYNRTIYLRS